MKKSGKANGLFILLDPNPYQLNATEKGVGGSKAEDQSFKVSIHTLAQFVTFGPRSYGMSTLKRMTGTKNFEQLPDHQKNCQVHNREECQTKKYLDHVQRDCKCIPWSLGSDLEKNQVKNKMFNKLQKLEDALF